MNVGVEDGSYIFKTAEPTSSDELSKSLKVVLQDPAKDVIKLQFKFTAFAGSDTAPDLWVSDKYNSGSYYYESAERVFVDNETGEPVANLELHKWYTLYITTNGQAEFRLIPRGENATKQVEAELEIKGLEAFDVEAAPAAVTTSSSTFAPYGLYKAADGSWQTFYSAYNRYSEHLYGGVGDNTAYNRRAYFKVNGSYAVAAFDFKFNVSQYKAVDAAGFTSAIGMPGLTVLDSTGATASTLVVGQWYTAIVRGTSGNNDAAASTEFYPGGYADGEEGAEMEVELVMKNFRASTAPAAHDTTNGNATLKAAGGIETLTADGSSFRYQLVDAWKPYSTSDRGISVTMLDGTIPGLEAKQKIAALSDRTEPHFWA